MANLLGLFRKTLKRGTNVVRRVGKVSANTLKRGTNTLGLTKRSRKSHKKSRKTRKSRGGRRQH